MKNCNTPYWFRDCCRGLAFARGILGLGIIYAANAKPSSERIHGFCTLYLGNRKSLFWILVLMERFEEEKSGILFRTYAFGDFGGEIWVRFPTFEFDLASWRGFSPLAGNWLCCFSQTTQGSLDTRCSQSTNCRSLPSRNCRFWR